jgi:hypothetical protein
MKRPCPMYKLLSFAAPNGIVLRSYQLQPGLGALKGREVLEMLERCKGRDKVIVGTACKCHGVITALRGCHKRTRLLRSNKLRNKASLLPKKDN